MIRILRVALKGDISEFEGLMGRPSEGGLWEIKRKRERETCVCSRASGGKSEAHGG